MEDIIKMQSDFTEWLLKNCAVAIFVINAEHQVIAWNKACEKLTGISAREMIGTKNQWMPFYDHIRPTLSDLVVDGLAENGHTYYSVFKKSLIYANGFHAEGWYPGLLGGDRRYIVFDAAPIYNKENKLLAAVETLQDTTEHQLLEEKKDRLVLELRQTLASIKTLRGLIPICSTCKKIRDDKGYWKKLETYLEEHSGAEFTHSLCPACEERFYLSSTPKR